MFDLLPSQLRVVARAGGVSAALRLVECRGGQRIYVPQAVEPDHWLVEIIQISGLQALVAAYPSEHIEVPKAEAALRFLRDCEMRAARARGASITQLAGTTRLSRRRVLQVLASDCGQADNEQPSLFE